MKKIIVGLGLGIALLMGDDKVARDVMQKVQDRDSGNNIVADMHMVLIDKNGDKRERFMKSFSLEIGDTTKKAIYFTAPSDVNNTAFLTYDYDSSTKDDEQWMYLPALKKTKRIPSSDKSSSFMGSDFTNSDMTEPNLEDYDYTLLKETQFKGDDVWVIGVKPRTQKVIDETGYSHSEVYVRKDILMPVAGKHYINNSDEVKLFQVAEFKQVKGIWFSTKTSMVTKLGRQTLHQTLLIQNNINMDKQLTEDIFTVRAIEKGL